MIVYHGSNVVVNAPRILQPNRELDFDYVCDNRNGDYSGPMADFAFGPVANDDVYRTLYLYRSGELTREETMTRLKVKKLFNQLVLKTERALGFLRFKGAEVLV